MSRQRTASRWIVWVLGVALLAGAPGIASAQGVQGRIMLKTGGAPVEGTIVFRPATKVYVVADKSNVSREFKQDQVGQIMVAKPAEMAGAEKMVLGKQYAAAIPSLEGIMKAYLMLQWDVEAARLLAECYLNMNDPKKAVQMCETVIRTNPDAAYNGGFARMYWDALDKASMDVQLSKILTKAIQEGTREVAAVAQIKRGDIDRKNGKLKDALVGGYLRTIVLFEQVKSVQPEAMYKAIKCFEELNQNPYAEKWRKKMVQQFPNDPWTQKLNSGT